MGFYRDGNSIDFPSSWFPLMEENSHLVAFRYLSRNKPSSLYINLIITMIRDSIFQIVDARCMWHARSKRQSTFRVVKFRTLEILITWTRCENFITFSITFHRKIYSFRIYFFPSNAKSIEICISESRFSRDLRSQRVFIMRESLTMISPCLSQHCIPLC